jgi:hypothetical protein
VIVDIIICKLGTVTRPKVILSRVQIPAVAREFIFLKKFTPALWPNQMDTGVV